ncbi:Naa25 [Acrasis kona]|uniref:Naa25 n=1 Tax=Acrasis kona TaxID=1008807 RepID=A0AAW2Z720_9EUKA
MNKRKNPNEINQRSKATSSPESIRSYLISTVSKQIHHTCGGIHSLKHPTTKKDIMHLNNEYITNIIKKLPMKPLKDNRVYFDDHFALQTNNFPKFLTSSEVFDFENMTEETCDPCISFETKLRPKKSTNKKKLLKNIPTSIKIDKVTQKRKNYDQIPITNFTCSKSAQQAALNQKEKFKSENCQDDALIINEPKAKKLKLKLRKHPPVLSPSKPQNKKECSQDVVSRKVDFGQMLLYQLDTLLVEALFGCE